MVEFSQTFILQQWSHKADLNACCFQAVSVETTRKKYFGFSRAQGFLETREQKMFRLVASV